MSVHLVPTPEQFARDMVLEHGPDARVSPKNRITACGQHMSGLAVTEEPTNATCTVCAKRGRA